MENPMANFEGKTVIVTGGGIGGATSKRFAKDGAKVAVFDMNVEAAQKVVDEIKAAGGVAQAFKCNIRWPTASCARSSSRLSPPRSHRLRRRCARCDGLGALHAPPPFEFRFQSALGNLRVALFLPGRD